MPVDQSVRRAKQNRDKAKGGGQQGGWAGEGGWVGVLEGVQGRNLH